MEAAQNILVPSESTLGRLNSGYRDFGQWDKHSHGEDVSVPSGLGLRPRPGLARPDADKAPCHAVMWPGGQGVPGAGGFQATIERCESETLPVHRSKQRDKQTRKPHPTSISGSELRGLTGKHQLHAKKLLVGPKEVAVCQQSTNTLMPFKPSQQLH